MKLTEFGKIVHYFQKVYCFGKLKSQETINLKPHQSPSYYKERNPYSKIFIHYNTEDKD